MKKIFFLILALFLLILGGCGSNDLEVNNTPLEGQILDNTEPETEESEPEGIGGIIGLKDKARAVVEDSIEVAEEVVAAATTPESDLPETFDQDMDFARQAPNGQWEVDFYQDGCEEASLIMIDHFFSNIFLDPAVMEEELKKVEPW